MIDEEHEKKRLQEIAEMCDPKVLTDNDAFAIATADDKIKKRTYYGMRREKADKPSVTLSWSNGSRSWSVSSRRIEAGEEVTIDANEILVPFSPTRMNRVLPCVIDLPLYFASTEAWARDEVVSAKTAIEVWALGQIEGMQREKWEDVE